MDRWQDITTNDANLKAEFISKFLNGDYLNAFKIIEDNRQLDTKAFVDNVLNEISNLLSFLQNGFQYGVIDYLSAKLAYFNNLINEFRLRHEWVSDTTYQMYNFVSYNGLDYMYINLTSSSGNLPTNQDYWLEIKNRGKKGEDGLGVNLKYDWDSTIEYNPLDVVYYNNALWVAVKNNINQEPQYGDSYQELIGQVITFDNGSNNFELDKMQVSIVPTQSGSGVPSLDNQRPIIGWAEAKIWIKSTYNIHLYPTHTISFGLPANDYVYSANFDLLNETITENYGCVDLGNLNWTYSSTQPFNFMSFDDIQADSRIYSTVAPSALCSCYPVLSYNDARLSDNAITIVNARPSSDVQVRTCVFVNDINFSDVESFKTAVSGQKLVYKFSNSAIYPRPIPVPQINLLENENNIWADCGDTFIRLKNSHNWETFLPFKPAKIYADMFPPIDDDLYNGAMWFEIIKDYRTITGRIVNFVTQRISPVVIEANLMPTQEGENDPSPTNVRPIIGHTGIKINVTAKNIFNISDANFKNGYVLNPFGGKTANNAYRYTQNYIMVSPSTTYCGQAIKTTSNSANFTACEYDENKVFIRRSTFYSSSSPSSGLNSGSFTTSATTKYIRFSIGYGTTTNIMISEGSEASDYEEFNSYDSLQFGLTVYCGKVNINNDGTGELKARPYYASYNGEDLVGPWMSSKDVYIEGTIPTIGAQVVDMGGTETTVAQLSFAYPIKALAGNNIIWVDDSNSTSVTYINN